MNSRVATSQAIVDIKTHQRGVAGVRPPATQSAHRSSSRMSRRCGASVGRLHALQSAQTGEAPSDVSTSATEATTGSKSGKEPVQEPAKRALKLAQRVGSGALFDAGGRTALKAEAGQLAALLVYGDETKTFAEDVMYYRQGSALLARDIRRDLPLLLAAASTLSPYEKERAHRMRSDLLSLLPFLFICINTVPITPAIMPTVLRYVPRKWVLPSSFDDTRLRGMRRLQATRNTEEARP